MADWREKASGNEIHQVGSVTICYLNIFAYYIFPFQFCIFKFLAAVSIISVLFHRHFHFFTLFMPLWSFFNPLPCSRDEQLRNKQRILWDLTRNTKLPNSSRTLHHWKKSSGSIRYFMAVTKGATWAWTASWAHQQPDTSQHSFRVYIWWKEMGKPRLWKTSPHF